MTCAWNFTSTFKDVENACIAENAADLVFKRKPVAAMDLESIVGRGPGTRAPSSFAMPASRSQRRPASFSRAEK